MSKNIRRCVSLLVVFLALGLSATAVSAETLKPTREFVVNDQAGVLSDGTRRQVIDQSQRFKNTKAQPQVVLATITDTDGQSLTDYANNLLVQKDWQLGKKGQDNGVLILYLADDKNPQTRITAGRGIEDILPDATCYNILRAHRAELKSSDRTQRDKGLAAVYTDVAKILSERYGSGSKRTRQQSSPVGAIFVLLALVGIPLLIFRSARRGGYHTQSGSPLGLFGSLFLASQLGRHSRHDHDSWSSGDDFGGFSDFGGGGDYGGGGASD